jgi:hypothetical protein
VDESQFAGFMSPKGAAFVAHWWNDTPQYDGLYDNQGRVRPAYFAFKLLSQIQGKRLTVTGLASNVKAIAAKRGSEINLLFWNFPLKADSKNEIFLRFPEGAKGKFRLTRLKAGTALNELELDQLGTLPLNKAEALRFMLSGDEICWIAVE